ncbi:malate/lactate/ureidoglycolate dehydrogenase [Erwinia persicina]|uniref:malate/lactate/ureidoglycolate dehydrogenase n=1 Tax=Erwinia persicina TaxID=55211 RepID=UPI0016542F15|nr:malate/lactate/ureidoglycolate dehydrogenase [Erwinia persicina]MBC3946802.1 malate/lactate/ureidoglycolate dehydrogenase [Erwinia persicina]MCQ4094465.1 malate/lactate/ureidoglycolate dehydrogenase [Erwinia persicina]MCQ4101313.1 malate/lactate/ureidoglycolate dehydrogenase [Erwinia persicina]
MSQTQDEIRIKHDSLQTLVQRLWQYAGSSEQEAQRVAEHLVAANLAGHDSHGVGMIPGYMISRAQGHLKLNQQLHIAKDAGAVITVDGGQGFGQVMAAEAMALAIDRTRELGMCAVALRNSHHIGRIGHWAEQCARAGFISFHFVNVVGDPMVAPFNGSDRRFGTNPFCSAFPRPGKSPLLLDFATSGIAFGKTRVAWNKGIDVAPGYLIDHQGKPAVDPAVMHETPYGSLLAFGLHKGYALAVMCEVLGGALSGGQTTHPGSLQKSAEAIFNCMTTVVLDPAAFDAPAIQREAEAFIEWVKASPQSGDSPIMIPGEWEESQRALRRQHGIPVDTNTWRQICQAAREAGMPEAELNSCSLA